MCPSYDDNNIFAKIIRDEIPAIKVYQDADIIAFMDVMPQSEGHILVLPLVKARNILDVEPEKLKNLMVGVQKIAIAAKEAFKADGITIMQFNEESAGQTVYHLHFHILPRYKGVPLAEHQQQLADKDVLEQNAQKIRHLLKNSA